MNTSKFLKKSLAMLLAILMVVAMIPLSAAATDASPSPDPTPEPDPITPPTITVNNRNAVKPQQEGDAYTVTVLDATTVDIAWVPEKDTKVEITTKRGVKINVPFDNLDLTQEGTQISAEGVTPVVYQLKMTVTNTATTATADYDLNITCQMTPANDDTTLQAVVVNQKFRSGEDDFTFLGIDATFDNENETVTIKLPLGMRFNDAGFSDTNFGGVRQNYATTPAVAGGKNITGDINENNRYARNVFVPTSTYSTVNYEAPTASTGTPGKLTVTARDGHTRNYTVNFVQEDGFTEISASFNSKTYSLSNNGNVTTDINGTTVYTIYVDSSDFVADATANFAKTLTFTTGDNVVRVEDPTAAATDANWKSTDNTGNSADLPLVSARNQLTFTKVAGVSSANNAYEYVLNVKTKANMEPNANGLNDESFYKNVKIIFAKGAISQAPTNAPVLKELQLNGYEARWNEDNELPDTINIYVDYDFEFSTGDGKHPARISAVTNSGNSISIPAQDPTIVGNKSRWAVEKTAAVATRFNKPDAAAADTVAAKKAAAVIDNVYTEGGSFVLRVWNGSNEWKDYTVNIIKPTSNAGYEPTAVKLMYWDATSKSYKTLDSTFNSTTGEFRFDLDKDWYAYTAAVDGVDAGPGFTAWNFTTGTTTNATITATQVAQAGGAESQTAPATAVNFTTLTTTEVTTAVKAALLKKLGDVATAANKTVADGTVTFKVIYAGGNLKLVAEDSTAAGAQSFDLYTNGAVAVTNNGNAKITFALDASTNLEIPLTWTPITATAGNDLKDPFECTLAAASFTTGFDFMEGTYNATGTAAVPAVPAKYYLKNILNTAKLIIDTPTGVVVTPGGQRDGRKTAVVGRSIWDASDGWSDNYPVGAANANWYTELEEGYTTLGQWMTKANSGNTGAAYVLDSNGAAATDKAVGTNDTTGYGYELNGSALYFSTNNGSRWIPHSYTIKFTVRGDATTTPGTDDASLTYSKATTAIDEDLVYGGNTVTNGIIVKNSNAVPTPYPTAGTFNADIASASNGGWIDPANAAYAGAINDKNSYTVTTQDIAGTNKHIVTIEVPEDFQPNKSDDATWPWAESKDGILYFTLMNTEIGNKVVRGSATAGQVTADIASPVTGNLSSMLSTVTQVQQNPNGVMEFKFNANDLQVWATANPDLSKVGATNILYVYSTKNTNALPTGAGSEATATTDATAIYYITVKRVAPATGDAINSISSATDNVTASLNNSTKTVTINVPASYNWIGYRPSNDSSKDFELNINLSDKALMVDAAQDPAIKWLNDNGLSLRNFELPDLLEQEQEVAQWVSADDDTKPSTQFFVKDGELYVFNQFSGTETQITGLADSEFINPQWGTQEAKQSELHVYSEGRNNANNYKLVLNILPENHDATITNLVVDETTAVIDDANHTAVVKLPSDTDFEHVRLSIAVSALASIESVNGEQYNPNDPSQTFDISKPITIVILSEAGDKVTYTLSNDEAVEPSPSPSTEPSPSPSASPDLPVDIDDVHSSMRAEVIKAIENGLMQGGPDNHFYPNNTMKRYEFALVVARAGLRAEGETGTAAELDQKLIAEYTSCDFADVTAMNNAAVSAAVQYVFEKGYMKGISDTAFNPTGNINRQEAALTMARVAGLSLENTDATSFTDNAKIASWAIGGVNAVVETGIMNGDGSNNTFAPTRDLTRAEGACILVRYFVDGKGQQPDDGDDADNPDDGDDASTPDDGDDTSTPDDGDSSSTPDDGDDNTTGDDDTTGDDSSSSTPAE